MNILVTGANGQLGNELRLHAKGSVHRFIFTDVSSQPEVETVYLDITDRDAVRLVCDSESVDLIVNCAAYTNVDRAEDDEATADLLNRVAPSNLAEVAAGRGATLIHISTDYVFPGDGCPPLRETDKVGPRSAYGRTKLGGERAVVNSGCNYIILRTAWLYSPFGKNFVKTMGKLTGANDSVKVVVDQVGSPTSAADLADAIMHIVDGGLLGCRGIYHFSDEGAVSWYDFAKAICELKGDVCDVRPCLSGEFPSRVDRPHYSVLDKTLFKDTFGYKIPYWKDSLEKCVERLWK